MSLKTNTKKRRRECRKVISGMRTCVISGSVWGNDFRRGRQKSPALPGASEWKSLSVIGGFGCQRKARLSLRLTLWTTHWLSDGIRDKAILPEDQENLRTRNLEPCSRSVLCLEEINLHLSQTLHRFAFTPSIPLRSDDDVGMPRADKV